MIRKNYITVLLAALLALTGCNNNTFRVSGHVDNAYGETLYLEHLGLLKTEVIDSVILPQNGAFKFREARPEYPDLYRLRINNATLVLAIDSLDRIVVEADTQLPDADIENSPKSEQIRELRRSLRDKAFEEHKEFAKSVIVEDPLSMVAYYALFQQKAGLPVFDVFDKEDRKFFSAVATSFNTWMPNYNRTKILTDKCSMSSTTNAEHKPMPPCRPSSRSPKTRSSTSPCSTKTARNNPSRSTVASTSSWTLRPHSWTATQAISSR